MRWGFWGGFINDQFGGTLWNRLTLQKRVCSHCNQRQLRIQKNIHLTFNIYESLSIAQIIFVLFLKKKILRSQFDICLSNCFRNRQVAVSNLNQFHVRLSIRARRWPGRTFYPLPGHYGPRLELVLKTGGFGGVTKLYLEKLVLSKKKLPGWPERKKKQVKTVRSYLKFAEVKQAYSTFRYKWHLPFLKVTT